MKIRFSTVRVALLIAALAVFSVGCGKDSSSKNTKPPIQYLDSTPQAHKEGIEKLFKDPRLELFTPRQVKRTYQYNEQLIPYAYDCSCDVKYPDGHTEEQSVEILAKFEKEENRWRISSFLKIPDKDYEYITVYINHQ